MYVCCNYTGYYDSLQTTSVDLCVKAVALPNANVTVVSSWLGGSLGEGAAVLFNFIIMCLFTV